MARRVTPVPVESSPPAGAMGASRGAPGAVAAVATLAAAVLLAACGGPSRPGVPDGGARDAAADAPGDGGSDAPGCDLAFPPLPPPPDAPPPPPPPDDVDPVDLVARWPLDGAWTDVVGGHDLAPVTAGGFAPVDVAQPAGGQAYGPTGAADGNGALGAGFTSVDVARGLTLEAWYYRAGNNTGGVIMGWGDGTYALPQLALFDSWGAIAVGAGQGAARVTASFPRLDGGCWYHLALVVPPGGVGAMRLYVDGAEVQPSSGSMTLPAGVALFGGAFRLGTWTLSQSVATRLDEARLWGRALTPAEVALRASPRGQGARCPSTTMAWEPGPRCQFPPATTVDPPLVAPSTVRVLTDDTVAWVTDPGDALEARLGDACGAYLAAMEGHLAEVPPWWWPMQYEMAALETQARYLPGALAAWGADDFLAARTCAQPAAPATILARWTEPVSEWELARRAAGAGTKDTGAARTVLVTWARLPFRLVDGTRAAVRDAWGNAVALDYDADRTISWALKLAQPGFAADDPGKRALLGAFLGPAGPLDLSRFDGQPFQVVREADGAVAYEGAVAFLADSTADTGERLWALDFGALTTPGRYHVRLPGAGRTAAFDVGPDALGASFLTHARGLYHNRCAPLDPAVTPWARGDAHAVFAAAFPPDDADYANHAADGWGFTDGAGAYASVSHFDVVAATATTTPLPAIVGGWHDAGDFDRRPMHLDVVRDLALAYLLAPENFTDGQLDLPASERVDGLPDVLDEAAWGLAAYRGAQEADGRVATWFEATSHPQEDDPGQDHQPYYRALATRASSLAYARAAALLSRALARAGATTQAAGWLASAEAAYAFGTRADVRVTLAVTVAGKALTWREPAQPDAERRLLAAVELALATGAPAYRAELDRLDVASAFARLRDNAWWQLRTIDLAAIAGSPSAVPAGWGADARRIITKQADDWRAGQALWPYGWAWYPPGHPYVAHTGWGQGLYKPLRELVLAWKLTGDAAYRHAALRGVAHLVGANAQGRSLTTGLGSHRYVTALHLPSFADGIAEASPGITIYGHGRGLAGQASTVVWGLSAGARTSPRFAGLDLTLLPPPYANAGHPASDARAVVDAVLPGWRRMVPLQRALPQDLEFTVWETIGPAVFVTGLLLDPGWAPTPAMLADAPLGVDAFRDNLWMMP